MKQKILAKEIVGSMCSNTYNKLTHQEVMGGVLHSDTNFMGWNGYLSYINRKKCRGWSENAR